MRTRVTLPNSRFVEYPLDETDIIADGTGTRTNSDVKVTRTNFAWQGYKADVQSTIWSQTVQWVTTFCVMKSTWYHEESALAVSDNLDVQSDGDYCTRNGTLYKKWNT